MASITDNDLKELKDLIRENQNKVETKLDKLEGKIDRLTEDVTELKVEVVKTQENVVGLDKRLSNIEFTNRGIFISISTGLVLAALGAFTKFLLFNPNI